MQTDFQTMIASFGQVVTIKRKTAGSYVDGRYVEGVESELSAVASVQPARGAQIDFIPSGQRTGEEMIAYIDTEVFPSQGQSLIQHDRLVWEGVTYKILIVKRWIPTQLYWEAIIVREEEQ